MISEVKIKIKNLGETEYFWSTAGSECEPARHVVDGVCQWRRLLHPRPLAAAGPQGLLHGGHGDTLAEKHQQGVIIVIFLDGRLNSFISLVIPLCSVERTKYENKTQKEDRFD